MNDYIDLNIIEKSFKEGLYYGTFSFLSDIDKVFLKAIRYTGEDPTILKTLNEMKEQYEIFKRDIENYPLKDTTIKKDVIV